MKSDLLAAKIRLHNLEMTHRGNSSHLASGLSIADILAVLYSQVMIFDNKNPSFNLRDRFILSKGHAGAALYACLAEVGFFDPKNLSSHYQNGSLLSGHVSHYGIPGVEFSTGSLGHGLSVGIGMSLAAKKKREKHRIYVLISDGELDEGSNWEGILFAAHHKLNNLKVIVDYNKLQSLDTVEKTLNLEPLKQKIESFNWNFYTCNGHNHTELYENFSHECKNNKPSLYLCNTVKGYGVDFMQNNVLWHYRSPQNEEYINAKSQLLKRLEEIKNAR